MLKARNENVQCTAALPAAFPARLRLVAACCNTSFRGQSRVNIKSAFTTPRERWTHKGKGRPELVPYWSLSGTTSSSTSWIDTDKCMQTLKFLHANRPRLMKIPIGVPLIRRLLNDGRCTNYYVSVAVLCETDVYLTLKLMRLTFRICTGCSSFGCTRSLVFLLFFIWISGSRIGTRAGETTDWNRTFRGRLQ